MVFLILVQFLCFLSRIGFVFILNTDEEVDGNKDAGVALWRALNYVADEVDIAKAFTTIAKVSAVNRWKFMLASGLLLRS